MLFDPSVPSSLVTDPLILSDLWMILYVQPSLLFPSPPSLPLPSHPSRYTVPALLLLLILIESLLLPLFSSPKPLRSFPSPETLSFLFLSSPSLSSSSSPPRDSLEERLLLPSPSLSFGSRSVERRSRVRRPGSSRDSTLKEHLRRSVSLDSEVSFLLFPLNFFRQNSNR